MGRFFLEVSSRLHALGPQRRRILEPGHSNSSRTVYPIQTRQVLLLLNALSGKIFWYDYVYFRLLHKHKAAACALMVSGEAGLARRMLGLIWRQSSPRCLGKYSAVLGTVLESRGGTARSGGAMSRMARLVSRGFWVESESGSREIRRFRVGGTATATAMIYC